MMQQGYIDTAGVFVTYEEYARMRHDQQSCFTKAARWIKSVVCGDESSGEGSFDYSSDSSEEGVEQPAILSQFERGAFIGQEPVLSRLEELQRQRMSVGERNEANAAQNEVVARFMEPADLGLRDQGSGSSEI